MAAPETYMEEMHQRFGYLATWLPNTPVRLGDIGILRRDRFEYVTTLADLNIQYTSTSASQAVDLEYTSSGSVELEFSSAASGDTGAGHYGGSVHLRFLRENAVLFAASCCAPVQLSNTHEVGKAVLEKYQAGTWDRNWTVVTEVIDAGASTILISEQASGELTLVANAALDGTLKRFLLMLAPACRSNRRVAWVSGLLRPAACALYSARTG